MKNGVKQECSATLVLENRTPDDVPRAMIEGGLQTKPFYIFNVDEAYRRIQHFREKMPRVEIYYAMKSNATEEMLKLAMALGLSFDCSSVGEIYKLRQLKVNPRNIIYANPCKSSNEMLYARSSGIIHTTFDSSIQLNTLKQYWPDAKLLIRMRIDGNSKREFGEKFGCDFKAEGIKLLDEAARLGLEVVGVAFHVGSISCSPESFTLGLRQAKVLFDHEKSAGRGMSIVDIGGGFMCDSTQGIDEYADIINSNLEELFPENSVNVIAEPGRYLSESAFKLFCSIIGVKRVIRDNEPINMIYLSNGIYGTMRFVEDYHRLTKFQRSPKKEAIVKEEIVLWGPTCDSFDRVKKDHKIELPPCTIEDWLVVDNHGAYTISFSTKFSSLEMPGIRSVVSRELWNHIKTSSVYGPSDFVLDPDISVPLKSTLPPVLPQRDIYEHSQIPTLSV